MKTSKAGAPGRSRQALNPRKPFYGGGCFLFAALEADGRIVLDFNRAINPPCAFNPFATCALPRLENRLPLAVTAGERSDCH